MNNWTGQVQVTGEQISQIFEEFFQNQSRRFEDGVEKVISNQFPQNISRNDYLTYIGTLSCLLWIDQKRYQESPPQSISINQKPNGCFKSRIRLAENF